MIAALTSVALLHHLAMRSESKRKTRLSEKGIFPSYFSIFPSERAFLPPLLLTWPRAFFQAFQDGFRSQPPSVAIV
jgi:hypothetical protein